MTAEGILGRGLEEKPPRLSGTEAPQLLVKANATDTLFLVSSRGLAAAVAVHTLPEVEKLSDAHPFNKLCPLQADEFPVAAFVVPARKSDLPQETFLLTLTRGGMVKKSAVSDLPGPSAQTFRLVNVNEGDGLGWTVLTNGQKELLLASAQGLAIRFPESEVRPMGLAAAGVNAIKLGVGDEVIGCQVLPTSGEIFVLASDGKAKRVEVNDFPTQGRYGKGVIVWDLPPQVSLAGLASGRPNTIVTIHLAKAAPKMTRLDAAPLRKRSAVRGEAVVELKAGDTVLGITQGWSADRFVTLGKTVELRKG
jgi:DNA gyrase subunit A